MGHMSSTFSAQDGKITHILGNTTIIKSMTIPIMVTKSLDISVKDVISMRKEK